MGITQVNNVTMKNITDIMNITGGDPSELFINVNHVVYQGWFWFIMLWLLGFMLFKLAQRKEDQPLVNAMKVFTVLSIIAFFLSAMSITKYGAVWYMLNDWQLGFFPLFAIVLATINHYISQN